MGRMGCGFFSLFCLEVEDELRLVVDPLALGAHHLLALLRRRVVEARVDLGALWGRLGG